MAVQANKANAGTTGASSVSCTFLNAQTAGNSNTVMVSGRSFTNITSATCTDTAGNTYTLLESSIQPAPSACNFLFAATGIVAAGAGANTVTVTLNTPAFDNELPIFIVEGPASTGVRTHNSFIGPATNPPVDTAVTLSGTVSGDYVVVFVDHDTGGSASNPIPGSIGTNSATSQLQDFLVSDGQEEYLVEDGTSSGGTISCDATNNGFLFGFIVQAVAFIPGASGAISGESDAISGAAGTLTATGMLSGSGTGVATASATIAGIGALSGASTAVAIAQATPDISGTSGAVGAASGSLTSPGMLSGASVAVSAASATGGVLAAISGTSSSLSLAAATLLGIGSLSGTAAAIGGASLAQQMAYGTSAAVSGATGTLGIQGTVIEDAQSETTPDPYPGSATSSAPYPQSQTKVAF